MGITAVVGAATSIYSMQQQDKAIKEQNKAAGDQYVEETSRAKRDAQDRQNQLTNESLQEASRFQQNREQLALEALREKSAARVASAESGVGGVTKVRSFVAEGIAEDSARADIDKSESLSQFNVNQRARGIATAQRDREVNAGFTFKSNSRRRLGTLDFVSAGVSGAASGYNTGRSLTS